MNKGSWKNLTFEFLSIFIAVISAFALNNWNDNRKDNLAESKILAEILNGLEKDLQDISLNVAGHEQGVQACIFWRKVFRGETVNLDTLQQHYFMLTRDFISVQNTSGYETLKSRGFELIKSDSLRERIISLYEFDYQTLDKLEEAYGEMQFHSNYFHKINPVISSHFTYDSIGNISGMSVPLVLKESEKRVMISYLWHIQFNRNFILNLYKKVDKKIRVLMAEIKDELEK